MGVRRTLLSLSSLIPTRGTYMSDINEVSPQLATLTFSLIGAACIVVGATVWLLLGLVDRRR